MLPDEGPTRCAECAERRRKREPLQRLKRIAANPTILDRERENKRRFFDRHPGIGAEYSRQHRARNPDAQPASWRKYYEKNRAMLIERRAKWARDHPEKDLARVNRRRDRKNKNDASCAFSAQDWLDCKASYAFTCLCCLRHEPDIKLTADHVIPVVKGGSSRITNIQPLCQSCNSRKGNKTTDYRLRLA